MKKSFLSNLSLFTLLFLCLSATSQSVSYKVVKNDPFDIKNFTLAIDPLFFDMNGENGYAVGLGIRSNFLMGKALDINLDVRNGFGTNGYNKADNLENTKNYFYAEGSIGLIFAKKLKTRNVRIVLSSNSYTIGGTTYTNTKYIQGGVPADIRRLFSLRIGASRLTNSINFTKALDDSLLRFENESTKNTFTKKENTEGLNFKNEDLFGAYTSSTLFIGLNFKTIRQLLIDVDGWGFRSNEKFGDFFIDVLCSPSLMIHDYKSNNRNSLTTYKMSYEGGKRIFGWRIGFASRRPKNQGFSYKFEFGQRPGYRYINELNSPVNVRNFYAMLTYGIYIPLKIKPIAEAD